MKKATLYDYWRFRQIQCSKPCSECALDEKVCDIYGDETREDFNEINEVVVKWCEENPIRTRQDKFLKLFPNAKLYKNVIDICPKKILGEGWKPEQKCAIKNTDITPSEAIKVCTDCKRNYWLTEVINDEG